MDSGGKPKFSQKLNSYNLEKHLHLWVSYFQHLKLRKTHRDFSELLLRSQQPLENANTTWASSLDSATLPKSSAHPQWSWCRWHLFCWKMTYLPFLTSASTASQTTSDLDKSVFYALARHAAFSSFRLNHYLVTDSYPKYTFPEVTNWNLKLFLHNPQNVPNLND